MKSDLLQGFYLGDFLIKPMTGQVTGRGRSTHLPPKAVEVLLCLAASPRDLVTREELLDNVWGSGHGNRETLGHAISEIRHALDDHIDNPHYIQTLPRRGYRLAVTPARTGDEPTPNVANVGLFENLKQRGVLETAVTYLVVGWLLIQVADIVFSQLRFPDWAATFVTVLVIAGFPIAVLLSWFLEMRNGRAVVDDLSVIDVRQQRFSRTYVSVVGALLCASLLVFLYDRNIGLPNETAEPGGFNTDQNLIPAIPSNSIAVLPFFNIDRSDVTQTFANGFVEDIITRLSRVPGLLVSSRGDSFDLDPNASSGTVRDRLRVAMYLAGSVEIAADQMRINVQLIDAQDGFNIQSRQFDRHTKDFFDIRDEVTNLTVSSLRVSLPENTQELSDPTSKRPNLDAYVLYRRGIDEARKPQTPSTVASALGWFDGALQVDPDYAAAYAGKCSVHASSFVNNDDPASISLAEAACASALERNPNLDVVHIALGDLYRQTGQHEKSKTAYERALAINPVSVEAFTGLSQVYRLLLQPEQSEEMLRKAIGLQPGNWRPYNQLGFFLFRQGRYEEAAQQFAVVVALDSDNQLGQSNIATSHMLAGNFAAAAPAFQKAIDIEPLASTYSNLGLMNYYLGNSEGAVSALRRAIELAPNDHLNWSNLGDVLWVDGKEVESQQAFQSALDRANVALEVNPNDPATIMDRAWILAMLGDEDLALEEIQKAAPLMPDDPYADYILALIHHRRGNSDDAIIALQAAVDKGYSLALLAAEPQLGALREDSRFTAIIRKQ